MRIFRMIFKKIQIFFSDFLACHAQMISVCLKKEKQELFHLILPFRKSAIKSLTEVAIFLVINASIEAITTLEGKSTLLATFSVSSKIRLALPSAFLTAKKINNKIVAIMIKITVQTETNMIKKSSRISI